MVIESVQQPKNPKGKLLVADDDPRMREGLQNLLTEVGYDVAVARDGQDAIARLEEMNYDVVIADMVMPNANGSQVIEYVREHCPHTKVIVVTGYAAPTHSIVRTLRMGAFDHMTKPLPFDLLQIAVERALLARRLEVQIERHAERLAAVGDAAHPLQMSLATLAALLPGDDVEKSEEGGLGEVRRGVELCAGVVR